MNSVAQPFEQYLYAHDATLVKLPITHTNMIGGKQVNDSRFANSGTYHIEDGAELKRLLLSLPDTYRHGLSQCLPEHFSFFLDLDLGVFRAPRPRLDDLCEWAIEVALQLQAIVQQQVKGHPSLPVAVSLIAARKVQSGFKPGVHLHMRELTVDRRTAMHLGSILADQLQFTPKLNFPVTDRRKVVDINLFANPKSALRMYNATKMDEKLTRYRVKAIVKAHGSVWANPSLPPVEEFEFIQLEPMEGHQLAQLCEQPQQSSNKRAESDSAIEPASKRVESVALPEEKLDDFDTVMRTKIALHFPEAQVQKITRTNGTIWTASLTSRYCWLKQADHDSASAFLTITKNGIQACCLSTLCKAGRQLGRVPCFAPDEVHRLFAPGPLIAEDEIAAAAVDEYNGRFAYVMIGENNCNLAVVERNYVDPVTNAPGVRFMNTKVFCEWYRDDRTPDGRVKCDIWLRSPRQARYKNIVFLPGTDTEPRGWFNMWQGFPYGLWTEWIEAGERPLQEYQTDPDMCDVMDFLLQTISAGEVDTLHYVLNWLAFAVQHPDQPSEVSLALRGARGIGKTFFGQLAARLFGIYGKIIEAKQLSADFNGSLKNTILMVADEASGQFDPELMVRLQHISTSEYLDINLKNVERFRVRNCLHIILCSNFERMVAAGRDGRRYCVLDVAPVHRKDGIYFGRLSNKLTPTFYSKFLTMLSHRNIEGWIRTDWPLAAQRPLWENKQVTLNATEHWFYEKLRNSNEQDWRTSQCKETVCVEVREYEVSRRQLPRQMIVEQELNSILKPHRVCTAEDGKGVAKVVVGGKRVSAFRFPSFEQCKLAFSLHVETNPLILWNEVGQQ